jgi:purine-binding chemotaxis protein CheW
MANEAQYVTLGLDRELFGIAVENVREILDMRPVSRLPHTPAYLLGIIDVRGRNVPVIDLRTKLGMPAVPATTSTRILVLEMPVDGRDLVLGLVADRVLEVTNLDTTEMEPAPDIGLRWRSEYITGIGRRGDAFVVVFDLSRLFASENLALSEGSRGGTGSALPAMACRPDL